jgi:hypothetical protein
VDVLIVDSPMSPRQCECDLSDQYFSGQDCFVQIRTASVFGIHNEGIEVRFSIWSCTGGCCILRLVVHNWPDAAS